MCIKRKLISGAFAAMLAVEAIGCSGKSPKPPRMVQSPISERYSEDPGIKQKLVPAKLAGILSKLKKKPVLERIERIYSLLREGGAYGVRYVRYSEDRISKPKTVEDVLMGREGDCNELTSLFANAFRVAGLDNRDDVKIGALIGPKKFARPDIWHVLPVVLVKGDVPKDLRFLGFEMNKELQSRILRAFGIDEPTGWHLITVDPQRHLGARARINNPILPLDLDGIEGIYHYELGEYYSKKGDTNKARAAFEKAIELNGKDPFSLLRLSSIYREAGDTSLASEHEKKAREIFGPIWKRLIQTDIIRMEDGHPQ